jgi:CheY-like chemotaxis protein
VVDSTAGPPSILIVEDETLLAMMLEDVFTDIGWMVTAAATVPQALDLIGDGRIDVALLDVNLAGHEVFPVADALALRGIPFVFATGYGPTGIRPDLRANLIITKPYRVAEVLQQVRGVCQL